MRGERHPPVAICGTFNLNSVAEYVALVAPNGKYRNIVRRPGAGGAKSAPQVPLLVGKGKGKRSIAVRKKPNRYENSRAIWDHTVLPATRQR